MSVSGAEPAPFAGVEPQWRIGSTPPLSWFAVTGAVCVTSGTMLYCYRTQLGTSRSIVAGVHQFSGDAATVALVVYLWGHLARTWRLRRRFVSWWSGGFSAVFWATAIVTGFYGQFVALGNSAVMWWVHLAGSAAATVLVCFHAAYGFRPQRNGRGR